jgi:hypothetical protein
MRERDHILKDHARYVQRMQKALTKMNLLLHNTKNPPNMSHEVKLADSM